MNKTEKQPETPQVLEHSVSGCNCFVCGGKPKDHECNEEAVLYQTKDGKRFFFADKEKSKRWYEDNYMNTTMGSVACSICESALIDGAAWL